MDTAADIADADQTERDAAAAAAAVAAESRQYARAVIQVAPIRSVAFPMQLGMLTAW